MAARANKFMKGLINVRSVFLCNNVPFFADLDRFDVIVAESLCTDRFLDICKGQGLFVVNHFWLAMTIVKGKREPFSKWAIVQEENLESTPTVKSLRSRKRKRLSVP